MSASTGSGAHNPKISGSMAASRVARPHPSAAVYMTAATSAAAALFFILWWMLQDEETPWVPAGLAASVVLLVAASARLITTRRTRRGFVADDMSGRMRGSGSHSSSQVMRSTSMHAATLRALQRQAAEADEKDLPEMHHDLYEMCCDYLTGAEKALQSPGLQPDGRVALRGGQDRVRDLQKHHLIAWARGSARALTREAQQRARLHEKIEAANRALDCIEVALKAYPDEEELDISGRAVREFVTSTRVAHWIEMAERAAFKGYPQRAIDCYKDALYYLTRGRASQASEAAAERISREIDLLRAQIDTSGTVTAANRHVKKK